MLNQKKGQFEFEEVVLGLSASQPVALEDFMGFKGLSIISSKTCQLV